MVTDKKKETKHKKALQAAIKHPGREFRDVATQSTICTFRTDTKSTCEIAKSCQQELTGKEKELFFYLSGVCRSTCPSGTDTCRSGINLIALVSAI